jgi:hypothetical protein
MLLPEDYFAVYGEKLAEIGQPKEAFFETEKQFNRMYCNPARPVVLRRFVSYESFQAAYRRYNSTATIDHIEIKILFVGELK